MAFVCVINRLLAEADVRERATQKNPDGVSCTPPSPATRPFQETGPSFPIYTLRPTQIEASLCCTMAGRAAVPARRQCRLLHADNLSRDSNC